MDSSALADEVPPISNIYGFDENNKAQCGFYSQASVFLYIHLQFTSKTSLFLWLTLLYSIWSKKLFPTNPKGDEDEKTDPLDLHPDKQDWDDGKNHNPPRTLRRSQEDSRKWSKEIRITSSVDALDSQVEQGRSPHD